jgi:ketosteroid isomerase-like protein
MSEMSRENVSALRSLYAHFADGDVWAAEDLLAPDVVSSWPDAGGRVVCQGRKELKLRLQELLRYWRRFRVEAQQLRVLNADSVLVVAHQYGKGEMSGIEMEGPIYTVWRFNDGRVIAQHWALDRDDALEAAGLSE